MENWIESFLESCGYLATFVGVMMEGEVSLVTSVVGAQSGYYNFWVAMFFAWLGAWVADWFKFLVARTKGQQLLARRPSLNKKIDKASSWYNNYPELILIFYKLFFGFTTILLVMSGLKKVGYLKFGILSAISVAIWTSLLGGMAYHCSDLLLENLKWASDNIWLFMLMLFGIIGLLWLIVKRPFQKQCLETIKES